MSKDVKIEVIYYKTETDVSLEFGLHGNYPVRLLSSSSKDLTAFFHSLKRAVSRSQIIIVVGGYKGDEYVPSFIARAINKECLVPEYNKAGVICKEKYPLPDGAVPLSPANKKFAGFLIESGPQTIISLTENKKIRNDTINEVIVKYIEEHHNFFLNADFSKPVAEDTLSVLPDIPQKAASSENESPTEFEDLSSSSEALTSDEPLEVETNEEAIEPILVPDIPDNSEETPEAIDEPDTSAEDPVLEETTNEEVVLESAVTETDSEATEDKTDSETEQPIDIISRKYRNPEDDILTDITPEDFNFDKPLEEIKFKKEESVGKTRPRRRIIRVLCIILSLLIIIVTALGIFVHKKYNNNDSATADCYATLTELFKSHGDDYSTAFEALREHNEKINGWISLNNSSLNYPILTTNDDYYFNRLPDDSENILGSVYTKNDITTEQLKYNVILYGSAESGLGVFSEIVKFFDHNNIADIEPITFTNEHGSSIWRIFSIFTEEEANELLFEVTDFDSTAKYTAFLKQLIRHTRTDLLGTLADQTSPILMFIATDGNKRYIACAAPFNNVSYRINENKNEINLPGIGGSIDDIVVNIKDAIIDFEGKTDENTDEFEQAPIDPDNSIILPEITVKPPAGNTSSNNSTTSSEITSSEKEESSQVSSDFGSSETSSTESVDSSEESSSDTTSSEEASSDTSTESSSDEVSSTPSEESSEASSSSSSESSSEIPNSSSQTSSEGTSSEPEPQPKPDVDPIYTWDITLYVKQSNGTIVYGTASEIVARVVEAEMGSGYPLEALKAQSTAAYCWLLNNGAMNKNTAPSGVPMKATPGARVLQAVSEVKGTLITYDGKIAQTYYYAYSAGFSANVQDIWTSPIPYLQSVECPVDTELSNFITTRTYTSDEVKALILKVCDIDVSEMDKNDWIKPIEYDSNNAYCTKVEIGGVQYKGTFLRNKLFGTSKIRSSAYTVTYDSEADTFTISCKGWGHGVGMSQQGAKAYANLGWTYDQILAHFYTGTTLLKY